MIITCQQCGQKNRIPNTPQMRGHYKCGACKATLNFNSLIERAFIIVNKGIAMNAHGKFQEAILYFQQALEIFRVVDKNAEVGRTLVNLGESYFRLSQWREALDCFQKAINLLRKLNDRVDEDIVLHNMGAAYHRLGEFQKAIKFYFRSLELKRGVGDHKGEGRTLNAIGLTYADIGEVDKAMNYYSQALQNSQSAGDRINKGTIHQNIAALRHHLGQREEALSHHHKALKIAQETEDRVGEGITLNNIAMTYCETGNWNEAIDYFEQALQITRSLGMKADEGTALMNLGMCYEYVGKPQEALNYYLQALQIAREVGDQEGEAKTLANIAVRYSRLGQWQKALNYDQKSLEILRKLGVKPMEAQVLNNIGTTYGHLGQNNEALSYHQKALYIAREVQAQPLEASALSGIATAYNSLRQFENAINYYEKAIDIKRDVGDREGECHALNALGITLQNAGRHQEAIDLHRQALNIARKIGSPKEEGHALNSLGHIYYQLNQWDDAISTYQQALKILEKAGHLEEKGRILDGMARVYTYLERWQEACDYFDLACEEFEHLRSELVSDDTRTSFFSTAENTFQNYIYLLMYLYQRTPKNWLLLKAFHICERGRARSLLFLLGEKLADIWRNVDPALIAQKRGLLAELTQIQNRLIQPMLSEKERSRLLSQRDEFDLQLRQLEAQIRFTNPSYATLTQPEPFTLQEVQEQVLDEETVLMEYALGIEASYLWVVTKHEFEVYFLPPKDEIEHKVRELRAAILDTIVCKYPYGYELYCMLVQPAEKLLKHKRLIIIPDGILYYLPFELLLTEPQKEMAKLNYTILPYLVRRHAIAYAPSATLLSTLKQNIHHASLLRSNQQKFIAFADPLFTNESESGVMLRSALSQTRYSGLCPLPATRIEAESIAKLFGEGKVTLRLGSEATKRAAQSAEMKAYDYVHFATHGLLNEEKPQFSGIVLTPDDEGDGFLQTFEIFNIDLKADIVVLSACQTGLGKIVSGEGVIGLTRAFFYAGASTVCASLWSVADESTADLMQKFYKKLVAVKHDDSDPIDKVEALQQAQIEMITEGKWSSPYYWAPFVLIGDWR